MKIKYIPLLLLSIATAAVAIIPRIEAATQDTVLTAEVVEGGLSMSNPNDLNFSATLNGKEQILDIEPIQTTITDYRSTNDGWSLTVRSPNFATYASNYKLSINDKALASDASIVSTSSEQSQNQDIILPVNVTILAQAKEGTYAANLEWNLQPNIKQTTKE